MKLKHSEIKAHRDKLLEKQKNKCWICGADFSDAYYNYKKRKTAPKHSPVLDHNHDTGKVRGVLCSGCNSIEGLIVKGIDRYHTNISREDVTQVMVFLGQLSGYYWHYDTYPMDVIHPNHKTNEEKRLSKNKKARLKRKKSQT